MTRLLFAMIVLVLAQPAFAQQGSTSELRVVVVDETGAGIPGAAITVTPAEGAAVTFTADERGRAISPALPAGAATLRVEFTGFDTYQAPLTLRRGAINQTVTLKVAGLKEELVVNDSESTDDRRGNAQTTTLEEQDIEQLPDDVDELAELLTQMAGGQGAVFQVNGFRGGRLPSRDEIRQIRFRTNSFSADNHDAGRTLVEIITRPNVRQWTGNANIGLSSDVLNARNAFARAETPQQARRFNTGVRGPIVPGKTSMRLNVDGNRNYDSPTIYALTQAGNIFTSQARRPSEATNATFGIEHALTSNNTLRVEYRRGENSAENQGVGDFTLPERAYERHNRDQQLRFQIQGVVRKTMLNEIRVQLGGQENRLFSLSQAPSINVLDAFNIGGAGINSTSKSTGLEVADNFDFSVGRKHQMRVGVLLEASRYENFDARNAAGTFTFSSIEDFWAARPLQFTQRQGTVDTSFRTYQVGLYWQDDIRVSRTFSFSFGLRQETQSLIDDKINLMPRTGFSWTPGGRRTTIRGGYGQFYDWYDSGLYDQTIRVNGVSQKDLLIQFPSFPDPFVIAGPATIVLPGGRVQAAPDLQMPYQHQASIGIERPIAANMQFQANYQLLRGRHLMRSINVNAPDEFGIRPETNVGTVTQFESTGRSQSDRLNLQLNYRLPQRRIFINGNYTLGRLYNHADVSTALPANSLDPDAEWGPSLQDVRHRFQSNVNLPLMLGMRTSINTLLQSAPPYNITTGNDDNGDGVVNDRPAGVGRNSARGAGRFDMSLSVSRFFPLGRSAAQANAAQGQGGRQGGGQQGGGPQGGPQGGGIPGAAGQGNFDAQRLGIEVFARANNVLNHVNYRNFVGNQQSRFYGEPTGADQPRRLEVGMQFRF